MNVNKLFQKEKNFFRKCEICDKILKKNQSRFCCRPCFNTWRRKENHVNWNGGSSWEFYHHKSVELLGNICKKCGSTKNVQTHHIDNNTKNNPLDGSNWIRVCKSCHNKIHWEIRKKKK